MLSIDQATHYDILDIKPDASPNQIREAYLRAKSAYHKESAALYALISTEEREQMIHLIEQAYKILSNPQRRQEYDQQHGFVVSYAPDNYHPTPFRAESVIRSEVATNRPEQTTNTANTSNNVISIDRTPPMETDNGEGNDGLLIAPSTMPSTSIAEPQSTAPARVVSVSSPVLTPGWSDPSPAAIPTIQKKDTVSPSMPMQNEIESETEWSGPFLRKIREANSISIEEIASITRINKHYLLAIEEDNYAKLPAQVYVRGFITQLTKTLKLPSDKVVNAYMNRLAQQREKSQR
jgi:curved DNA-binding protein CbpA